MSFRYVFFSGGLRDKEIPMNPQRNPTKLKAYLDHRRFYDILDERLPLMILRPNIGGEWTYKTELKRPIAKLAIPPREDSSAKAGLRFFGESKNPANANYYLTQRKSPKFLDNVDHKQFASPASPPKAGKSTNTDQQAAFCAYHELKAKNIPLIFHPQIKPKKLMNYLGHKQSYDVSDSTVPMPMRDMYVAGLKEPTSNLAIPRKVERFSLPQKPIRLIDYINHRRFSNIFDKRVPLIVQSWKIAGNPTHAFNLKIPTAKLATPLTETERPKKKFDVLTTCIHLPRKYLFRRSIDSDEILPPAHFGPSYIYKTIFKRLLQKALDESQDTDDADMFKKQFRVKETARQIEELALEAIFLIHTELGEAAMTTLHNTIAKFLDLAMVMVLLPNGHEDTDFNQSNVNHDPAKSSNLYKSILNMLTSISMKNGKTGECKENLNSLYAAKLEADIRQRVGIIRKVRADWDMPEFLLVFVDPCDYEEKRASFVADVREKRSTTLYDTIVGNIMKRRKMKRKASDNLHSDPDVEYKQPRLVEPAPWNHNLRENLQTQNYQTITRQNLQDFSEEHD